MKSYKCIQIQAVKTPRHAFPTTIKFLKRGRKFLYFINQMCNNEGSVMLRFIIGFLVILITLISMPIFLLYRFIVYLLLNQQCGNFFGGLLHGPDVIWAAETPEARSIITVLMMVEMREEVSGSLLHMLLKVVKNTIFSYQAQFSKLTYVRRSSRLGYHYWYVYPNVDVEDFVRPLEPTRSGKLSKSSLNEIIGDLCNKPLPLDDTATWEILVGQEPLEDTTPKQWPVIVRLHHSVGDGAALMRLLFDIFADPKRYSSGPLSSQIPRHIESETVFSCIWKLFYMDLSASICDIFTFIVVIMIVCAVCIKSSLEHAMHSALPALHQLIQFSIQTPIALYDQLFAKTSDNILYGKNLSGKKVVSWTMDRASNKSILEKVRMIRQRVGFDIKFTDVILTCLCRSLKTFYLQRKELPPNYINVVVPALVNIENVFTKSGAIEGQEMKYLSSNLSPFCSARDKLIPMDVKKSASKIKINNRNAYSKMENKFSAAILKLPLDTGCKEFEEDLFLVAKVCQRLRTAPDYTINYWMLRWIAHILPIPLIHRFLSNAPCSLVFSNLPGPTHSVRIYNVPIRSITFWVPNRGLTGIGISMLSYGGSFGIGIVGDSALILSEEVDFILNELVQEINVAYLNKFDGEHPNTQ